MKPRKPIKRSAYLPRGTKPPRARKADPKKRRFAKHRCEPFLAWLREQPCCITKLRTNEWHWPVIHVHGVRVTVDAAHVKTRGTGGDDLWNALPLAHHLHMEQHTIGWPAFEKKYGIDRHELAQKYTTEFLAGFPAYEAGAPPE